MSRARSGVVIGREQELAILGEAGARARAGEPQVVLVTGPAGIGKTRLVEEVVATEPDDCLVVVGHGVPLTTGALPFGVVGEIVRGLADGLGATEVAAVLGDLTRVIGPLVPGLVPGTDMAVDRMALFHAVPRLVSEAARARSLVLVAEDAHWADDASWDLLVYLARTMSAGRCLLLLTMRESEIDGTLQERVADLARLPNATLCELGPMDVAQVAALVRELAGDAGEADISRITELSSGIPFLVEELTVHEPGRLPALLRVDLTARLGRLDPRARTVVETAAVESRPFATDVLGDVAGVEQGSLAAAVDAAVAGGLLDRLPDGRWRFHHDLLRAAVAHSLPPSRAADLHRRWAQVLAEPADAPAGDLISAADHWEAVGTSREAYLARVRAAEATAQIALGREAAAQWRKALELIHQSPRVATEEEWDETLGRLMTIWAYWPAVLRIVEAEESASPGPTGMRQMLLMLARFCVSRRVPGVTAPTPSHSLLRGIRESLTSTPPSMLTFATSLMLAQTLNVLGDHDELALATEVLADRAQALPDSRARGNDWVSDFRVKVIRGPGQFERRLAFAHEALDESVTRDWASRSSAHSLVGWQALWNGDLEAAIEHSFASTDLVPDTDPPEDTWYPGAFCALQALRLTGRWDDAVVQAERCGRIVDDQGVLTAVMTRALIATYRGDGREAQRTMDELRAARGRRSPDPMAHVVRLCDDLLAALRDERSRPAEVRTPLLKVLDHPRDGLFVHFAESVAVTARLCWRGGPPPSVDTRRLRALADGYVAKEGLDAGWTCEIDAHLSRAEGADDPGLWREAVDSWQRLVVPFQEAGCRVRLCEALLEAGDRPGATAALEPALAIAEALGATPLSDEIRGLGARHRLRLPARAGSPTRPAAGLTAREQEVLEQVVLGHTNSQIADVLFMSPKTVSVHVSRILAKLGAANRTEIAAIAHREGLLTSE